MASRSELYRLVDRIRGELGIKGSESLRDLKMAAYGAYGIITREVDFQTESLCGMAHLGEPDIILLNRCKPEPVKRFALAHELIHIRLHRDRCCAFMTEDPLSGLDPALEREANDGAAELLLPWREYLPLMRDCRLSLGLGEYYSLCRLVCPRKRVSRGMAQIRVKELWHCLDVYLATGSMDRAEAALDDVPVGFTYGRNFERIPIYKPIYK